MSPLSGQWPIDPQRTEADPDFGNPSDLLLQALWPEAFGSDAGFGSRRCHQMNEQLFREVCRWQSRRRPGGKSGEQSRLGGASDLGHRGGKSMAPRSRTSFLGLRDPPLVCSLLARNCLTHSGTEGRHPNRTYRVIIKLLLRVIGMDAINFIFVFDIPCSRAGPY